MAVLFFFGVTSKKDYRRLGDIGIPLFSKLSSILGELPRCGVAEHELCLQPSQRVKCHLGRSVKLQTSELSLINCQLLSSTSKL